jgi:hypothetical protein
VTSDRAGLAVELVRRDAESHVLTLSGELSRRSAELAMCAVSKALADVGRVLVDVSGLRLTWPPAVQLFPPILEETGGWPAARLVLFGADGTLADSLAALKVSETVPVAPDETTARQLLQQRPPAVARHLDLDKEPSSPRRARLFVKTACKDWQLDAICDDATLVASELVENAISDAGTSCRLSIRRDARGLTITVRDYQYRGLPLPLAFDPAGHRATDCSSSPPSARHGGSARPRTARACGLSCRSTGQGERRAASSVKRRRDASCHPLPEGPLRTLVRS